jgi:hypothetical protein
MARHLRVRQSGRVRSTLLFVLCEATTRVGGCPFSTHCSSGTIMSKVFGPTPPPQCPMPGTMNSRSERAAFASPIALVALM